MKKLRYRVLGTARVVSQFLFLGLFLFLFVKTDYTGSDSLEYAVNILFRLDPLLALATLFAVKTVIALMVPGFIVLALSLLVGRSFCGWFCPLGSLLDGWRRVTRTRNRTTPTKYPDAAKIVLLFVLASALLGVPLAGYVDPFSILIRGMAHALYPGLNEVTVSFFTFTYQQAPEYVNRVTEPVYDLLRRTILPFEQKYYELTLLSLVVLALVFAAEFVQRRFFCRNVCPLGALLGWVSRLGLFRVDGGDDRCGTCRLCAAVCRMGAIDEERHIDVQRCIVCMDCFRQCPQQIISFAAVRPVSRGIGVSLSRRRFIGTLSVSLAVPAVLGVRTLSVRADPLLIRPPGALAEDEFLDRCVRCGQCMQVCITNGLQPALLEAGIEGMFSPYLVARTGYCEFNCTLCGQVCPTGAIRSLELAEKHRFKIGHAWFDKDRCLPFAKNIPCIVCEEHCPTPDKAIKFSTAEVVDASGKRLSLRQPYIDDALCIGCGICETKCPLPGRSAIYVTSAGEQRDPRHRLPVDGATGGGYS